MSTELEANGTVFMLLQLESPDDVSRREFNFNFEVGPIRSSFFPTQSFLATNALH